MDAKLKKLVLANLSGYEREFAEIHEECIPRRWGGVKEQDRDIVYKRALEEEKHGKKLYAMKTILI